MLSNSFLIVNPGSGRYSGSSARDLVAELTRLGLAPQVISARTPGEISRRLRSARSPSQRLFIIVAAGDGTFNAVLNSIQPGTATLAVLPMGTSNVLAAELGIRSLADGIGRIIRGDVRSLP